MAERLVNGRSVHIPQLIHKIRRNSKMFQLTRSWKMVYHLHMANISSDSRVVYSQIQKVSIEQGKSPTIQELVDSLGLSTRKVVAALRELEDALIIKRSQYRSRSIELIAELDEENGKAKDSSVSIPIVGTAPGGHFLLAEQNIEDHLNIPTRLLKGKRDVFLLRVAGDSMSPFLEDGDLAVVKQQNTASSHEVIVAVREGISSEYEATIKEFVPLSGNQVILNPINKKYKPIVETKENVQIQGVVIGAIKMFGEN